MRIEFNGTTNHPYMMVNTAHFRTKNGEEVVIDRDESSWTINDDKTFSLEWRGCYLWDGEEAHYDIDGLLDGADLIELEVEDDAPDADYMVTVTGWGAS